jgi:hypothetical protein
MKTVNNKIKKPFVSIGFDATGELTFNVDLNKTKKLNVDQLGDLGNVFENVVSAINNNGSKTILHIFDVYRRKTGIEYPSHITVNQLEEVKSYLLDNQKLMAVKTFKDLTSSGLKESKDFCDFFLNYIKYS